jgi:membrane protease YdiL (CAAX protease family)
VTRARTMLWLGALARVLAFAGLFVLLGIGFGALWSLVPADVRAVPLLGNVAVTAAAATLAGAILIRGVDGRSPAALGIGVSRMTLPHCAAGIAIGAGALAAAALALLATGALDYAAQTGSAGAWLGVVAAHAALFTLAAYAEEVLFRGYAFQVLARAAGPAAAAVVTSVLFAIAHARNPSVGVFALLNIFLAGLLLAAAYLRTLSLWFATAVHMGWNWAMASLFDLPVSGITGFDTPLYEPSIGPPAWWSGGMFGPEGGLVGTLGFALALVAVLRWRAVRADPAIAAAGPLVLNRQEESYAG